MRACIVSPTDKRIEITYTKIYDYGKSQYSNTLPGLGVKQVCSVPTSGDESCWVDSHPGTTFVCRNTFVSLVCKSRLYVSKYVHLYSLVCLLVVQSPPVPLAALRGDATKMPHSTSAIGRFLMGTGLRYYQPMSSAYPYVKISRNIGEVKLKIRTRDTLLGV